MTSPGRCLPAPRVAEVVGSPNVKARGLRTETLRQRFVEGHERQQSETALYMEVAKIQLKLGQPRNETYREVTARAVDMVQKNSS